MATIYEPKGRAREYAALALNVYTGCDHRCEYCYAPDATQNPHNSFIHPRNRAANFLSDLERDARRFSQMEFVPQILLCFTCDPYQAFDVEHQVTRRALEILRKNDLHWIVLTKGGKRALRDLDLYRPGDSFSTTMTFVSKKPSEKWEPGATLPKERAETLLAFHNRGIETWVSLEPVIEPRETLEVIRRCAPFVDLFKVGRLNHHPLANEIDWRTFALQAVDLLEQLGKKYYVKDDLAATISDQPFGPHRTTARQIEVDRTYRPARSNGEAQIAFPIS